MKRLVGLTIILLAALGMLSACGTQPGIGTTDLQVLLTDAPASEATSLTVDFGRIDLVPADESEDGIVSVAEDGGTVDVLELRNGGLATLGELSIENGTYSQIRLIVDSAEIAFNDGAETYSVTIPSGAQTGLKINVEPPLVADGTETSVVVVDFDASRAVIETPPGSGNYVLKPTGIRAVTRSGILSGSVVDATSAGVPGAQVQVFEDGGVTPVTETYTEEDGSFKFITLLPGTYDLVVTSGAASVTVEDVVIETGVTTDVGSIALPAAP